MSDDGATPARGGHGPTGAPRGAAAGGAIAAPSWRSFEVRPYRPPPWLPGPHAQTIGGRFLRPVPPLRFRRERIDTPDGDFLDLDLPVVDVAADAPIVLLLHGLEGHARARYMLTAYHALAARGIRPVGLNFRSCSGEPNRRPRFYHSGETGDPRFTLDRLADRFDAPAFGVMGYSLGGNVALKLLGDEGEAATRRVAAAVAVSVPFDLAAGAAQLERGIMGPLYTAYFLRKLRRKVHAKAALLRGRCDVDALLHARTLREFDDAGTAPLHGFRDAEHYYRRASSGPVLPHIRVPTLLLQAENDPFQPPDALPTDAVDANPWLVGAFAPAGGHVGFMSGPPWARSFWAEREAARFLAEMLG